MSSDWLDWHGAPVPHHLLRPPAPDAAELQGPHFVGVGAAKSGTSRWFNLIGAHPEARANLAGAKEVNFLSYFGFQRPSDEDIAAYRRLFARPAGTISGEWSPGYFALPFALEHLARAAPDARIILILRDPVTRMLSQMSQIHRVRGEILKIGADMRPFFHTTTVVPEAFASSLYAAPLKRLLAGFDERQVLILQFEQCVRRPRERLSSTYRFLEVDDGFTPETLAATVNGSPRPPRQLDPGTIETLSDRFTQDVAEIAPVLARYGFDFGLWPHIRI